MRFTVVWMDEAQDELTRIWYRSSRKQFISESADAIDLELKTDAQIKGTRKGIDRVLSIRPLAVLYYVSLEDRLVRVLSIAEETN